MILAVNWLNISINVLLVVFVIISLLMVLVILMQRPKQEGLGAAFGANVTDQVFGARTTNVLQRATVWFASLFFVLTLVLSILIGQKNKHKTYVQHPPAASAPAAEQKSLDDQLKQLAPEAPAIPEVPAPAPAPAPEAPKAPETPPTAPEAPQAPNNSAPQ